MASQPFWKMASKMASNLIEKNMVFACAFDGLSFSPKLPGLTRCKINSPTFWCIAHCWELTLRGSKPKLKILIGKKMCIYLITTHIMHTGVCTHINIVTGIRRNVPAWKYRWQRTVETNYPRVMYLVNFNIFGAWRVISHDQSTVAKNPRVQTMPIWVVYACA